MRSRCFALGIFFAFYFTVVSHPEKLFGETTLDGRAAEARVDKLVVKLGDASFTERERAAKALEGLGMSARPALLAALKHSDLEIRLRAHEVLVRVLQRDFENRLDDLIQDELGNGEHALPAWPRVRDVLGRDVHTRHLYVEMARAEPELMQLLDSDRAKLQQYIASRAQSIQFDFAQDGDQPNSSVRPGTIPALLFAVSQLGPSEAQIANNQLYGILHNKSAISLLSSGPQAALKQRLLNQWVVSTSEGGSSYYGLTLALRHNLSEAGLEAAKRLLNQSATATHMIQYAAIAVARFGDEKQVALLTPHLQNKTVCHTWHNGNNNVIKTEIRDVVLAMLLALTHQSHSDYGFETIQPNPETLFQIYSLGFGDEAKRAKALQMWDAWARKQG